MQTTAIDILNLLTAAGIDRERAEPLAKEILTRSEAKDVFVSNELLTAELQKMRAEIYRAMMLQTGVIVAMNSSTLALFFNFL